MALTILGIGLLVFFGHFLTGFFERTKIPDVLVLMLAGIVLGPVFNVISPEDFGKVGPVFTTLALVVILFEGGIQLNVKSIAAAATETLTITLTTFVLTVLGISLVAEMILSVDYRTALLTATILGGTSAAVVVPLVRVLRMRERPSTVLFLESAITDVLVVVLTLALIQVLLASDASSEVGGATIVGDVAKSFLLSAVVGAVGAFLWSALLDRIRQFPNTVFTTFAYVFILYGIAELQGYSGAIAALTFGIAIANFPNIPRRLIGKLFTFKLVGFAEHERAFFAEIVFLVKTFFFVFLGLSITLSNVRAVLAGIVFAIIAFVARIIVIRLMGNAENSRREAMLMTALVPKGLASAVLASLPVQVGLQNGDIVQATVYAVILFTIVLCALFVFIVERGTLDAIAEKFFSPFSEVAMEPEATTASPMKITQQSLGLPELPSELLEPNPIRELPEQHEPKPGSEGDGEHGDSDDTAGSHPGDDSPLEPRE